MEEVLNTIPQRDPFLFIEKINEFNESKITCYKKLTGEEDFFKGHFPGNPTMPGVLLCEACFQAGAALMSKLGHKDLGVVTRIRDAKFKNFVVPGDELTISVELEEQVSNAFYMKGKIEVNGKAVLIIKFSAASIQ